MGNGGAEVCKGVDKLYLISAYTEGRGIWAITMCIAFIFDQLTLRPSFDTLGGRWPGPG